MVTYGRAWRTRRRPRSARFGFLFAVLLVAGLVASPFYWLWHPLGAAVAVLLSVGWYAAQLRADWRAGAYR